MNGLELSRGYYEEFGRPMLEESFGELLGFIAAGFVGSGSEHYGFDDDISRDHDYEPGFCIFLPSEDVIDRRKAFLLERAYTSLPKEYRGIRRLAISPAGGRRNGVFRTSEFYTKLIGTVDGRMSDMEWLRIPDWALAEAVNGEVFYDGYGEFSAIRSHLQQMPRDIKIKRLAGNILVMAQAGQYNFERCIAHGEPEAAQLACGEFVSAAVKSIFLIKGGYAPFYKWSFRALRALPGDGSCADMLSILLRGDNSDREDVLRKAGAVEAVSSQITADLAAAGYIQKEYSNLEELAYALNGSISDSEIRNLHILAAV